MMTTQPLRAIIWDYDCTLADTWYKNMMVTRRIVERVIGRDPLKITALASIENYRAAASRLSDWRVLYMEEFGLSRDEANRAGKAWTEFQLEDSTPVRFFDGIPQVLDTFKAIPQGVVSLNSKHEISKTLQVGGLREYFAHIVGYEDVGFDRQKPEPDALLACIDHLVQEDSGQIAYIGDHEADAACVVRTNQQFRQQQRGLQVFSIGAMYGCAHRTETWNIMPDYTAYTSLELLDLLNTHG